MQTVWDTRYTTGSTSGRPTPFVSTSYDFFNILELQRNMLLLRGVSQTDTNANLINIRLTPHGALIRVMRAVACLNVSVSPVRSGNSAPYLDMG